MRQLVIRVVIDDGPARSHFSSFLLTLEKKEKNLSDDDVRRLDEKERREGERGEDEGAIPQSHPFSATSTELGVTLSKAISIARCRNSPRDAFVVFGDSFAGRSPR